MLKNDDFISYTLSTRIRNLTSGTQVSDASPPSAANERVELLEISEDKLKVSLPANSCAEGHILSLTITLRRPGLDPIEAEIDAIVLGKKSVNATQDKASLELRNPGNYGWNQILKVFSRRQAEIEEFLRNAKGIS